MNIERFFEYKNETGFEPIKSFYLKDELNPKVWSDFKINESIKDDLLKISSDYLHHLDIGDAKPQDIILTGSLSHYNWSEYSDFDVHLIFDFEDVNEDTELVRKYFNAVKQLWTEQHDIKISGFDVELYCQDINEEHGASGQFSLLNDKWIKKPTKENFVPDEKLIKEKANTIMKSIDNIEKDFNNNVDHNLLKEKIVKVWDKIKDGRKAGIKREGEFSIENLVFKLLRRNSYIEKILNIKRESYDRQFK